MHTSSLWMRENMWVLHLEHPHPLLQAPLLEIFPPIQLSLLERSILYLKLTQNRLFPSSRPLRLSSPSCLDLLLNRQLNNPRSQMNNLQLRNLLMQCLCLHSKYRILVNIRLFIRLGTSLHIRSDLHTPSSLYFCGTLCFLGIPLIRF